jgi:hypothetical protein
MLVGENIIDVQNERATILAGFGSGYPNALARGRARQPR